MAHFAELNENNTVLRVVVVGNDINTSSGLLGDNDMHVDGETWCAKFFKTDILPEGKSVGDAKTELPEGKSAGDAKITRYHFISWDEVGQKWTAENEKDESNSFTASMFNWDVSTSSWIAQ